MNSTLQNFDIPMDYEINNNRFHESTYAPFTSDLKKTK